MTVYDRALAAGRGFAARYRGTMASLSKGDSMTHSRIQRVGMFTYGPLKFESAIGRAAWYWRNPQKYDDSGRKLPRFKPHLYCRNGAWWVQPRPRPYPDTGE